MQRIFGNRPFGRQGRPYEAWPIQALDRLLGRQSRRNQLASAAEARHQVLLNETERNMQVGAHEPLVDVDFSSAAGIAQESMLGERLGVVAEDAILRRNLPADNGVDLLLCRSAMQSGRNENRHPFGRNSRPMEPLEQRRQRYPVRCRTRDIANADGCGLVSRRQFAQRGTADRSVERGIKGAQLITHRTRCLAQQQLGSIAVWNRYIDAALAKRKPYLHLDPLSVLVFTPIGARHRFSIKFTRPGSSRRSSRRSSRPGRDPAPTGNRKGGRLQFVDRRFPDSKRPSLLSTNSGTGFRAKPVNPHVEGFVLRRMLDISLASLMLITVLPLLAVAAVAIKLDSENPVLFLQQRMGRRFRRFKICKLRTMHVCGQGPTFTLCEDPRITRTGRWLRRLKIDELPQLWNVVRGQMSLVGPRPMIPELVLRFRRDYRRLLEVRPGLTDPATLKYCREEDSLVLVADPQRYFRTVLMPDKVRLSRAYLERANFWSDLGVLAATCIALLPCRPRPRWRAALSEPESDAAEFMLSEPMQVIDAQSSGEGF